MKKKAEGRISFLNFKKHLSDFSFWLLPYFLFFLLLFFFPLILLFSKGLQSTFEEQTVLLRNSSVIFILIRSIFVGFLTAFFAVIISLIFFYIILQIDSLLLRQALFLLLTTPLVVFSIIKVWALKGLTLLINFGDPLPLNSYWFLILGLIYLYLPLALIPIYLLIKDMPKNLMEASYDLGFGRLMTFFKVTIPYSLKGIFASFSVVFLTAATSIIATDKLLPDGRSLTMVANVIHELSYSFNQYQFVPLIGLIILVLLTLIFISFIIQLIPNIYLKFISRRWRKN